MLFIGEGDQVFIPMMPMKPGDFPVEFTRVTFPVRGAWCITVNKSQGQSMDYAGLYFKQSDTTSDETSGQPFAHGQCYVAFSRVGNPSHLYVYSPKNKINNIVYPEVL